MTPRLSFAEDSLCRREAGEKEKESMQGTMGRGRREASAILVIAELRRELERVSNFKLMDKLTPPYERSC